MIQIKQFLSLAVFGIVLNVAVLCLSVALTIASASSVYYIYNLFIPLYRKVGLSFDALMLNFNYMIRYIVNPFSGKFALLNFSSSPEGAVHFEDVQKLVVTSLLVGVIVGAIFLTKYWPTNNRNKWVNMRRSQLISWSKALPIVVSLIVALFFDRFFVVFHELLFSNDYWVFDPLKDPIINVLPATYFMIVILLALLYYEMLLSVMTRLYSNKKRH